MSRKHEVAPQPIENISNSLSPFQCFELFKDQKNHSISVLQPYKFEESDEEGEDNTIGELLSPFSINPDDY